MQEVQLGWLSAFVVVALAGWIAEQLMRPEQGLLMNIIMGIIGAIVANALLAVLGVGLGGVIGYLIVALSAHVCSLGSDECSGADSFKNRLCKTGGR